MELRRCQLLFLDAQITGLSAQQAELLELGWSFSFDPSHIRTSLTRPSSFVAIPKKVWRMTELTPDALASAPAAAWVWQQVLDEAERGPTPVCAAVIHYSQFELPFLAALHRRVRGETVPFPWPVVCTYRLAGRLEPDLPAHSLRALSGRLGFAIPEAHRCREHVAATQTIWRYLIEKLKNQEGVRTWQDYLTWEKRAPQRRPKTAPSYLVDRTKRLELPERPGVYELVSITGQILYVGKASSLRARVNSYFRQRRQTRRRLHELVTQTADIRVISTETSVEAALLEHDRIKDCNPPYNHSLRQGTRRLFYFSKDLMDFSLRPDDTYPWGPFPSEQAFESLVRLWKILKGDTDADDALLLQFSPEQVQKALEVALVAARLSHSSPRLADLLRAGKRLPAGFGEGDELLTAIVQKLHRAVARFHRARWLCWLTESQIAWRLGPNRVRCLTFKDGKLAGAGDVASLTDLPPFQRPRFPFRFRQERMDIATYDRMRVLSTELKGLSKHKVELNVRFSPRRAVPKATYLQAG